MASILKIAPQGPARLENRNNITVISPYIKYGIYGTFRMRISEMKRQHI